MKSSAPLQRVPCLDGLRAVSVTLVLAFHCISSLPIDPQLRERLWQDFGYFGHLGVLVFFVISGYIITTLLEKERARTGTISLAGFYVRRIFRILPALYLYIAVIGLLGVLGYVSVSREQLFVAPLFLCNQAFLWPHFRDLEGGQAFFGHLWTLCIEEQFYLLWPAVLLFVRRRFVSKLVVGWILLSPLCRVFIYFQFPPLRGQMNAFFPPGADCILFGCLCAWWQSAPTFENLLRRYLSGRLVVAGVGFLFLVGPFLDLMLRGGYQLTLAVWLKGAAVSLVLLYLVRSPGGAVGRWLERPWMVHFGKISYSTYIWQQLFLMGMNKSWTGIFPLNLVVTWVVAESSYRFIEMPFAQWRRQSLARAWRSPQSSTAAAEAIDAIKNPNAG